MKVQLAVLLAGLAVASAAVPNHPFFTGALQAAAKGYREYEDRSYDYDTQKLVLQGKTVCFANFPFSGPYDFALGVDCAKDDYYHHHEDVLLDVAGSNAGWCLFNQDLHSVGVPGTTVRIASTFTAQCFLHSGSRDCNLGACENAVMHVQGVTLFEEDIVYEVKPFILDGLQCPNSAPRFGGGDKTGEPITPANWGEELMKAVGRSPADNKKSSVKHTPGSGSEILWKQDGTLWYGIATTYDAHGKLLGTGNFQFNVPFGPGSEITAAEAGNRKRYVPFQIKTGVNSIKAGEHYSN